MTSAPTFGTARVRHRIRVRGLVQGVGFRPFVYRLARDLQLDGHVGNDTDGVFVEAEGPEPSLDAFARRLRSDAPPLARIDTIEATAIASTRADGGFRIIESHDVEGLPARTFVAPDAAVCEDCLNELADPTDRRYRYPFITCTNCGPRFTITLRLPYDRPNTTMADFELCPQCASEYEDPADRRFHAQPLACARCGPYVWFEHRTGRVEGTDDVLAAAHHALAAGEIVAIKGLGGYHLACAASIDEPVRRLRERKGRVDKPFAVMVRDLAVARRLAEIDGGEANLLASPARPIVLVAARADSPLSALVAPANPLIGVMLPYTPLHHLLFAPVPRVSDGHAPPEVLVMTSGNLTDEPICFQDADARQRLGRIADAWIGHNRPIHVPCDDSVVRLVDGDELPIRRSRGYAPLPIRLPTSVAPALAVGGELKNAFCLAAGHDAWMSQHIGDMGSTETLVAFERSVQQFRDMYEIEPQRTVADAHPGYHTRHWAETRAGTDDVVLVQHHHAHVVAVMAEHQLGVDSEVIGCAYDGTGYGTDGAIWGGEILRARYAGFDRIAHLRYVPLAGRRRDDPQAVPSCPRASVGRTGPVGHGGCAGTSCRAAARSRCSNGSSSATCTAFRPRAWAACSMRSAPSSTSVTRCRTRRRPRSSSRRSPRRTSPTRRVTGSSSSKTRSTRRQSFVVSRPISRAVSRRGRSRRASTLPSRE